MIKIRMYKIIILISWIVFNILISSSLTNINPARLLSENFADVNPIKIINANLATNEHNENAEIFNHPSMYLKDYLYSYNDPPPISLVLDMLFKDTSWQSKEMKEKIVEKIGKDDSSLIRLAYYNLFDRVRLRLAALAMEQKKDDKEDKDLKELKFYIGYPFFDKTEELIINDSKKIKEIIVWNQRYPFTRQASAKRDAVLNNIIAIISLGSLGSLVFLLMDLMSTGNGLGLLQFSIRPLLGIFLAMALYVLLISTHTFISESDEYYVRISTMYAIALAGGLLSEKAYHVLSKKLNKSLDDDFGENNNKTDK